MIKFLRDHSVGDGDERESFKANQVVEGRSEESEMHFVRRGHAAFVRKGKLYDHEDRLVEGPAPKAARAAPGSRKARERAGAPRAMAGGNSGKTAGNVRSAAAAVKRAVTSRANLAKRGK